MRTFCFFQARAVCEWSHRWQTWNTKNEYVGWLLLAARGWRGFCFLAWLPLKSQTICYAYKNHDSPAAGGDQQASLTWAAGGLRVAERNGAGMERKVLSAAKPCSVMQVK
ncbi:MAG: hypothetical protein LWX70_07390 [Sphingobacteriia bacterium]|nr:hypothetical protein [Sphingobacteriia bacterium]